MTAAREAAEFAEVAGSPTTKTRTAAEFVEVPSTLPTKARTAAEFVEIVSITAARLAAVLAETVGTITTDAWLAAEFVEVAAILATPPDPEPEPDPFVPGVTYTFIPPTEDGTPPIVQPPDPQYRNRMGQNLMRHYKSRALGRTVLKNQDGTYTSKLTPTQDECAAAAAVYLGGHSYQVSAEEAAALTAAGYTVT